jgi:uncharacterized protein
MAKLLEKINQDLKQAMIGKAAETLSVLRLLLAALHNKEITMRKGGEVELNDEQVIETIASELKKRKDSIEAYTAGGRQDLADKEKSEMKILEKYLPEQMSDEELEKVVLDVMASGADNFGKVMGQVMAKVKGKADGNRVSEVVKKILAK